MYNPSRHAQPGVILMRANRRFAFAALTLSSLLLGVGCVDLTTPRVLSGGRGGQGGTTSETTTSVPVPETGGSGGTMASATGGITRSGGATADNAGGATVDEDSGLATGGVGGTTANETGGVMADDGDGGATTDDTGGATALADGGVTTGGAGGGAKGGAGGTKTGGTKTGGTTGGTRTGGTTATGGKTSPRDAADSADLRPGNEVSPPADVAPLPDAAVDAPGVPDARADRDASPDAPTAGLVLYYSCEQANGTSLPDLSGNGKNGTLIGPFNIVPGRVGNALALTATNTAAGAGVSGGYVSMPLDSFATVQEITIATWFKINNPLTYQRVFDIGTIATASSMFVTTKYTTGNLHFTIRTSPSTGVVDRDDIDGPAILAGDWHHVAVVLDAAGNGRLYLDGTQVGPTTAMKLRPAILGAAPNDWIGRSQFVADPYFDGAIDEFRIYNRALGAAEIQALYNQ